MLNAWIFMLLVSSLSGVSSLDNENAISGCGGFVKAKTAQKLKYDLIQIHLVTADGAIKDKTECAPHNGYFFVPTFEQGSYKLKVVPPAGWFFEPSEYEVVVSANPEQSTCQEGKDLNFVLTGFTVSGKTLTQKHHPGPKDVDITLSAVGDSSYKKVVKSLEDGKFKFAPVLPGKYQISIINEDYLLENNKISVEVVNNNIENAGPLNVLGYSLRGSVSSESEPVLGVKFLLFPQDKSKVALNCPQKLTPADGFKTESKGNPQCYVVSNSQGLFTFPALMPGNYELMPFYKSGKTQFDVKPPFYKFTINDRPLVAPKFEVSGFSVTGSVSLSPKSAKGIEGADVFVNGKKIATTDSTGKFLLEKMTVGQYTVTVVKQDYTFEPIKVHFSPSKPELATIYASKANVCGQINVKQLPMEASSPLRKVEVVSQMDSKSVVVTSGSNGLFCIMSPIGFKSSFKPVIEKSEQDGGLVFKPIELSIPVEDVVTKDKIVFEQSLITVSGTVECFGVCFSDMPMKLLSTKFPNRKYDAKLTTTGNVTKFAVKDVLYDVYTLRIDDSVLCWKENDLKINAKNDIAEQLSGNKFQQTGYMLNFKCSFESVDVTYKHKVDAKTSATITNVNVNSKVCVPKKGEYELSTTSCFKFDDKSRAITIGDNTVPTVNLEPIEFKVEVSVQAPSADYKVLISHNDGPKTQVRNEKASKGATAKKETSATYSVYAKNGDAVTFFLESETLLFTPNSFTYTTKGDNCPGIVNKFSGRMGEFVEASLSVATPEVTVDVLDEKNQIYMTQQLSAKKIKIGPLEDKSKYTLKITKPGYIFTDNKDGTFSVHKLASIAISVKDEADLPLVGALMSVSEGERQFRSNNLTNPDGKIVLLNLGPGEYFIKPLKKEYTFNPPNKLIRVGEGENSIVEFTALRTAFTCFGVIRTPSLDLKSGVTILASGVGETCSDSKEEGISQSDGSFTILGLQSSCDYDVAVRLDRDLEYGIPQSHRISVAKRDITGINFVVFPRYNSQLDLNGYIKTDSQFLNTLTVNLYHEDQKNAPIESQSLDQVPFFFFTSLTPDEKFYVLRLESSLPKSDYNYDVVEHRFQAVNSSHHVRFSFNPVRNTSDDDVTQGGLLVPLLIVLAGICMYNYQKVKTPLHSFWLSTLKRVKSATSSPDGNRTSNAAATAAAKKKKSLKSH